MQWSVCLTADGSADARRGQSEVMQPQAQRQRSHQEGEETKKEAPAEPSDGAVLPASPRRTPGLQNWG